jgi:uncharacterized membrane protein YedE/YeeE
MENFTPVSSTLGGILIGLSAALVLFGLGRIAGISGIFGGLLVPRAGDVAWRLSFVIGLLTGGVIMNLSRPELFTVTTNNSLLGVAAAGLVVGFGTRMGNGCTSGHGVCGISRGSPRSLTATMTFMATGMLTVFLVQHVFGGSP